MFSKLSKEIPHVRLVFVPSGGYSCSFLFPSMYINAVCINPETSWNIYSEHPLYNIFKETAVLEDSSLFVVKWRDTGEHSHPLPVCLFKCHTNSRWAPSDMWISLNKVFLIILICINKVLWLVRRDREMWFLLRQSVKYFIQLDVYPKICLDEQFSASECEN